MSGIRVGSAPMGSLYPQGNQLYAAVKLANGKWKMVATGFDIGQEAEARKALAQVEADIRLGKEVGAAGPVTLRRYAKKWLVSREGRIKTVKDDRTRLELHVLPRLGDHKMADLRPRHFNDLVADLIREGKLAPATIRNIYGVLRSLFNDAHIDEAVMANPVVLRKGLLPPKEDKDPEWRVTALYEREELGHLLYSPALLWDRRMVYALKGLAGLRHGEAAGLCWHHYDANLKPLGRLVVARSYRRLGTKTGVTRLVPVHATLAALLAEWWNYGWMETFGRDPTREDLIVPTRRFQVRKKEGAWEGLRRDLEALGLRHRRGHDLRRTFVTMARADGARLDLLSLVTHGPGHSMMDIYSTMPWANLCAEVARIQFLPPVLLMPKNPNNSRVTPPGLEGGACFPVGPGAEQDSPVVTEDCAERQQASILPETAITGGSSRTVERRG